MLKKIVSFVFILAVSFFFISPVQADIVREVASKWDGVAVAADTAWTVVDKNDQSVTQLSSTVNQNSGPPVKHIFQFSCATAVSIYLDITYKGLKITHNFNKGEPIGVNDGVQRGVIIWKGMVYEIKHKGPNSVACGMTDTESFKIEL